MRKRSIVRGVASDPVVFFAAGLIGFGPSVAVMYHALRTYDYPYTERAYFDGRRVFLALAVGMILGTVSGAVTVALRAGILTLVSLAIVLLAVAVFEEAFKLIYLNRKGYRGRFDTTFVGLSLGIGTSAVVGAGSAYVNGPALLAVGFASQLAAFSASLAFVHASTGAIIGDACSKGQVAQGFLQAFVARCLHSAILLPFFAASALPEVNVLVPLTSLVAANAFTFLLYTYAYRTVLPGTLPPDLRRERRRRVRETGVTKE